MQPVGHFARKYGEHEEQQRPNETRRSSTSARRSRPEPMSEKWVAEIFARMQARYPHVWASAFPNAKTLKAGIGEWARQLGGLGSEDVARGLDTWRGPMPPSVVEFRDACRPVSDPCHKPYKALPRPKADPVKAAEALQAMRAKLGRAA